MRGPLSARETDRSQTRYAVIFRSPRDSASDDRSKGTIVRNLVFVVLFPLFIAACARQQQPAAPQPAVPATTQASSAAVQEVVVEVDGAFYKPATIELKAGQPARLVFRRSAKPSCGDEIVFPDLNIRKKIAANETVTIDIPAQEARSLKFACGMDMMRGTVVVQ
jgi:hypothetical protein